MVVYFGSYPVSSPCASAGRRNLRFGRVPAGGARSAANCGGAVVRRRQPVSLCNPFQVRASSINDLQRSKSSLESLFCYDKSVPEEIIEKPVGTSLSQRDIGSKPPCNCCHAKGAILCMTCNGSGLYVDSILESQGIIVKVRCLGCGGSGNIMCSECGGRGHIGSD